MDTVPASHLLTLKSHVRLDARLPALGHVAGNMLRVGVIPNSLPPFDLVDLDGNYEGISSDYLSLVAQSLGARVTVRAYSSREAALYDLAHGDLDMVTTITEPASASDGSAGYYANRMIEIAAKRGGSPVRRDAPIGYVDGQVDPAALRAAYPGARLQPFETLLDALTQVSRGRPLLLVANATAAGYLVSQYQIPNLVASNISTVSPPTIAFAVRDPVIRQHVNDALDAIPNPTRLAISAEWAPTALVPDFNEGLNLTTAERKWIAANPVVRYRASRDRMPFVFIDDKGDLTGLSTEVLERIGDRTGLRFEPYWPDEVDTSGTMSRYAPMVLPVMPAELPARPGDRTAASEPYFRGAWAIVTRTGERGVHNILDLANKTVAVVQPNPIIDRLRSVVPVRVLEARTYRDAYRMVAEGEADATLASTLTADYLIREYHANTLKIAAPISGSPVNVSIGVPSDQPELLSIINKGLMSISKDELGTLRMRWSEPRTVAHTWHQVWPWLFYGGVVAALVSGVLFMWAWALRREVRQRVNAERALQEQLGFQHALLDAIPQPIYLRDTSLRVLTCNKAFEQILGQPREALRGLTVEEMPRNIGDAALSVEAYRTVLRTGMPHTMDRKLYLGDQTRDVLNWIQPMHVLGKLVGIVGGWVDLTERQQMLKDLAAARDSAEAANRAKSAFLASISHEIRTPMNAILGMLELTLARRELPADGREQIQIAQASALSLIRLIDDILDVSKMEAGQFDLLPQPASLRALTDDVVRLFALSAEGKGVKLSAQVSDAVAPAHMVDPLRFRQLLNNLVSNALRFTEHGHVTISLDAPPSSDGTQRINFSVTDSGAGIPRDGLSRLFQPFTQLGGSQRSAGGTGLGLTICRELATRMHGAIGIDSTLGEGTCVSGYLMLPVSAELPASIQPPTQPAAPAPRSALSILIVDDHAPNRVLLERQLQKLGHRVTSSCSGADALQLLARHRYDLVICDYSMPVMDGATFTQRLRGSRLNWRDIPVIGYTASAQPEIRRRALESGMNAVLVKPVNMATLAKTLAEHACGDNGCAVCGPTPVGEAA